MVPAHRGAAYIRIEHRGTGLLPDLGAREHTQAAAQPVSSRDVRRSRVEIGRLQPSRAGVRAHHVTRRRQQAARAACAGHALRSFKVQGRAAARHRHAPRAPLRRVAGTGGCCPGDTRAIHGGSRHGGCARRSHRAGASAHCHVRDGVPMRHWPWRLRRQRRKLLLVWAAARACKRGLFKPRGNGACRPGGWGAAHAVRGSSRSVP
mmetsp:Transcript_34702/g.84955  ORF Transcript_34702/g.84955 Transcript_34702/m.84955 type:complete len:206 (-) Transcript_34702:268-885(-)